MWDFLDTKKPVESNSLSMGASHAEAPKPQETVENGFGSNLTSLQRAQLTAQAVAHSTGQAVQKLSHHQHSSQNHSQSQPTPPERGVSSANPFQKYADNFAHSTPVTTSSQPSHANGLLSGRSSDQLSPIERAVYTAEQVAESTGEAVQKLSQSLSDTRMS